MSSYAAMKMDATIRLQGCRSPSPNIYPTMLITAWNTNNVTTWGTNNNSNNNTNDKILVNKVTAAIMSWHNIFCHAMQRKVF